MYGKRFIHGTIVCLLLLLLIAGCAQEPGPAVPTSTQTPLPTLALKPAPSDPTPTLARNAPTRSLPTPLVTRTHAELVPHQAVTPTPSPSGPSPTPSATPRIEERLAIGEEAFRFGDYETAVEQFGAAVRQEPALGTQEQAETLLKLGRAYLYEQGYMDAATIFNQLLALHSGDAPPEVHFWLGQAYLAQNEFSSAIEAYEQFLSLEPQMGGYVYPLIAEAYRAIGNDAAVREALAAALESPVRRLKEVETRLALAAEHLAAGNYDAAIEQYDAVHDLAETEVTRGQMTYLAGSAELLRGDAAAAHERFLLGLDAYPGAYESYLGLVELVRAEVPVDDYQRGLVDYYAAAYAPAVEAFQAYIASAPTDFKPDAHYYLALSHEALGDLEAALAEIENYRALAPQEGLLEEAKMRARRDEPSAAVDLYEQYFGQYPDSEEAPFAAWWLAVLTAEAGDIEEAIERFATFAAAFPDHADTSEALYRAGNLASSNDNNEVAQRLWLQAAEEYPETLYGSAALLALVLNTSEAVAHEVRTNAETLAISPASTSYQALRARDLVLDRAPFTSAAPFATPGADETGRREAEAWLAEAFALDPALLQEGLGQALQEDERLAIGRRLWELGLYQEAKWELEALRQAHADDALSTYQLALLFRDLGLYRSSIIAAATLLNLAGTHELEAPAFIGRLAYPIYYADLVTALAEQHGYDPRLQFSLVRQESLFESFARSGAAAQGLSQVIPDTGAWIAERLQWPDYENSDLYKPYVGLTFGAYYLAEQLSYFGGDVHAALAAYNAGPGNAARWYEVAGSDLDLFVDTIDFNETKTYVERIYAGYTIYRHLYGGEQ